ncbi:MAG: hypothetical protein JST89_25615 [Cyanobacteria bacterium SZAS-4]|nr:hypothetical protein [Cyanobacteria bacterium SZAS-4]
MPLATLETPKGPIKLHVCKDGTFENTEWIELYEEAFPPSQRQNLEEVQKQLQEGVMELDETRDSKEEILCMTLTEVFGGDDASEPNLLLACYTAVSHQMRGLGIGSIHRRKLGELLSLEYPDYLGIFSEIESTKEKGIDPKDMLVRTKRKSFFMKLGLIPIEIDYLFPSYNKGEPPLEGELLWVPFGPPEIQRSSLEKVLRRIYIEGYRLEHNDPLIEQVLKTIRLKSPASSLVALG